jgi:hypothetical protein
MQAASTASGDFCDLDWYLRKNAKGIINYQEWRRAGRRISTSAVELTVNRLIGRRMCKSQKMCWTKQAAHLLLRVRPIYERLLSAPIQGIGPFGASI